MPPPPCVSTVTFEFKLSHDPALIGQYVAVSLPIQKPRPLALMVAKWMGEPERSAIREKGAREAVALGAAAAVLVRVTVTGAGHESSPASCARARSGRRSVAARRRMVLASGPREGG